MELVVQIAMGLIAVGSFVGQTRYALSVIVKRLDALEGRLYNLECRLFQTTPQSGDQGASTDSR